jgi:hypothetical protein
MTQEQHPDSQSTPFPGPDSKRSWIALVFLCLGQFMFTVDDTVVNVALPSIERSLGFDQAGIVWVVNIYALCLGASATSSGRGSTRDRWVSLRCCSDVVSVACMSTARLLKPRSSLRTVTSATRRNALCSKTHVDVYYRTLQRWVQTRHGA